MTSARTRSSVSEGETVRAANNWKEILMGKSSRIRLAKRDDPIFSEGPSFYTRKSDRGSTPSTPSSPTTPDKDSGPGFKASKPTSTKEA
jgi:hypothetical protein